MVNSIQERKENIMHAILFSLFIPAILVIFQQKKLVLSEMPHRLFCLFYRYILNAFFINIISFLVMLCVCDEGTSFLLKADGSPLFTIKYVLIELVAAFIVGGISWLKNSPEIELSLNIESFRKNKFLLFLKKYIFPASLYVLTLIIVLLNVRLLFDNVLWGDEAYSANLMRNNLPDMMQIITLQEPHPPLYYFWLKLWTSIIGYSCVTFHFASFIVFVIGILLAITLIKKYYGKIPAAIYVTISGLSAACVEYNVEVRMYALAFFGVTFAYFFVARILQENKTVYWIFMIICSLIAAYSHYYALMIVGIMIALTYLFVFIRFGKKAWIKVIISFLAFLLGYLPWISTLFMAINRVHGNWWMTVPATLDECLSIIGGSEVMKKITLPAVVLLLIVIFIAESTIFSKKQSQEKVIIEINAPKCKKWSSDFYALLIGFLTVLGTIIVAYVACALFKPVLAKRYVYPLLGIIIMMLVIGFAEINKLFANCQINNQIVKKWISYTGKSVAFFVLSVLIVIGYKDYRKVYTTAQFEEEKTTEILQLIGESEEEMTFINHGISHIGWTVLKYYYPDAEVLNGSWQEFAVDDYWYFTSSFISQEDVDALYANGYIIEGYGERQLGKYPLVLYHFYK